VPGVHVPEPLHVEGPMRFVVPEHEAAAHTVPTPYFAHAPMPSHDPFVPHDIAPWSVH
jgi:hypothetical protein